MDARGPRNNCGMSASSLTFVGVHHVGLPVTDIERSRTWYETVLGFRSVLDEETEDGIATVTLEHPSSGIILCLFVAPPQAQAMADFNPVSLSVASASEMNRWEDHLSGLGIEHSAPRNAYLGWAMDVIDPDGKRIQLHTRERISADVS
jgi:catechol 2,3-dioxygenase-like lactoylglutathione lyase family enzyme